MKYILILLLLPTFCYSQIDSSKTKLSIIIAAKNCEYISLLFEKNNKYEDIDSTTKKKFRIASPPTNNTNVQIDSVESRILADLYGNLSYDPVALSDTTKCLKDYEDACRASGGVWLNIRIDRIKKDKRSQYDVFRDAGRLYLRKQEN